MKIFINFYIYYVLLTELVSLENWELLHICGSKHMFDQYLFGSAYNRNINYLSIYMYMFKYYYSHKLRIMTNTRTRLKLIFSFISPQLLFKEKKAN